MLMVIYFFYFLNIQYQSQIQLIDIFQIFFSKVIDFDFVSDVVKSFILAKTNLKTFRQINKKICSIGFSERRISNLNLNLKSLKKNNRLKMQILFYFRNGCMISWFSSSAVLFGESVSLILLIISALSLIIKSKISSNTLLFIMYLNSYLGIQRTCWYSC